MKIFQVDAFTDVPFQGNPAGVCLLDRERDATWMQNVAAEMNLSETAFLIKEKQSYRLRWFTPKVEVSLCGHATLASAHTLWESGDASLAGHVEFSTLSGDLIARRFDDCIELDFPALPVERMSSISKVNQALGLSPVCSSGRDSAQGLYCLLEAESETAVRELSPDFDALLETGCGPVIVTSRSDDVRFDFVSRFFAPCVGIPEDPVTGSAHCALAPYWAEKLRRKELTGHQVSARTGVVGCVWNGDRVSLRGNSVTVFRGELLA